MRVLVSGGAGFIGSHVVDQLVAGGHDVVVIDRQAPAYQNRAATYHRVDLRHVTTWPRLLAGVDAVSHQAARVGLGTTFGEVADYVADNDMATAALLAGIHSVGFSGRFVLAASMVAYGEGGYRCPRCGPTGGAVRPGPRRVEDLAAGRFEPRCPHCGSFLCPVDVTEDAPLDPRNVYAATKVHQEHLCHAFGRETGAPVTALRYHNVYGPRCPVETPYAGVASRFLSSLVRGEAPEVFEDGRQRRDFVHVHDVARANVLALEAPAAVTGPFNVASGRACTVFEMADALWRALGRTGEEPRVTGAYRLGDVRHIVASPERAARVLNFSAAVDFTQGMAELARAAR
jgi:dTDP-L-rhamnose 4-epimerase